jgi:hypothetical protein
VTPPTRVWGIVTAPTRAGTCAAVLRGLRAAGMLLVVTVTVLLGAAGTVMASTSSANADILGISGSVQDWICGIVNPTEPWEGVGDGPESWLSNRNLAGAKQVAPVHVDAAGQAFTAAAPATAVIPDTMDQLPALPPGDYTLYEVAGLRGLSWWTIPLNVDGSRNCSLWNYVWSQAGNLIFTISKTAIQVTISIKEAAAADDPLKFLYDESGGAVSTVFAVFFIPIASLMFILAGIWAGINALRHKGIRAALGAAAVAAGIMALAGFAYTATTGGTNGFRSIAGTVDTAISQVNAVATNALFDELAEASGACTLPDGPASAIRGQRLTSCVLADALAYRPWAIGQFGGAGAGPIPLPGDWTVVTPGADGTIPIEALREEKALPCYVTAAGGCQDLRTYLIAQHGGVQIGDNLSGQNGYLKCSVGVTQAFTDSPAWMLIKSTAEQSGESTTPIILALSSACSPMYRVFKALSESNVTTAQAYAGDVGISRVTQAFSSLIGTAVTAVPVLITGIITMAWIALTFALYITGPFKLAFATYTGKAKMAKEWAGDLVHAWASRLAYGILLSLTVLIIAWMLASTISFGLRLVWLGVILFFFWKLVQKVQELIRPGAASIAPHLAGDVQRRTAGAAKTATRAATRSTVGAGAGVIAAGQRRRMIAADPTRGPIRRTAGTLLTPVSLLTGGLRGATFGPQDAHRRSFKTMSKAQVNAVKAANTANAPAKAPKKAPGTTVNASTYAGRTAVTPNLNVRLAASSHGTARDAAAATPVLPRRRPPIPARQPGPATPANVTGQPAPEIADTVSLPRRASLPQTEQISRPAVQAAEPSTDTDWWPAVVGHQQPPNGTHGDEESIRRPEPTPGKA